MPPRSRSSIPAALVACLFALCLAACSTTGPARDATPHAVVVLSVDGLPASTVGDGSMPTLDRLARDGVHAQWLTPSFPTLTFPNHYTLATGLRPDHHGIVGNYLRDAAYGDYHSKTNGTEGRWYGGEPIWATLQRQGGRSAVLAWVGGQDPADPRVPARMLPFDGDRGMEAHVDQVLAWLDLPAGERPQLVMDYLQFYDVAAHAHGATSGEAMRARRDIDAGLARLLAGIRARGLESSVDVIVLSDHGMQDVPPAHVDWLDPRVPRDAYDVVGTMVIGIFPKPGREAEVAGLVGRHAHHACHARGAMPPHWQFGTHPRVPPILCVPDPGWYLFAQEPRRRHARVRGEHGFDNLDPAMRAMFVARGPSFRQGITLPPFDNVDIYPLLAHLLGITPAPNDGRIDALLPALRESAAR